MTSETYFLSLPPGSPESVELYRQAFQACDDLWSAELKRVFGRRAGDARYTAEGRSTAKLAELHADFCVARTCWERELQLYRMTDDKLLAALAA